MNFNERIDKAIALSGLTQTQIAERVKLLPGGSRFSQQTVSKIKKSTYSKYSVQIAIACNISPVWLVTGSGDLKYKDASFDWVKLAKLVSRIVDILGKDDIDVSHEVAIYAAHSLFAVGLPDDSTDKQLKRLLKTIDFPGELK